jgi:hypothetical protein
MGAVAFHHFRIRHLLSDLRADAERYHPPDIRMTRGSSVSWKISNATDAARFPS